MEDIINLKILEQKDHEIIGYGVMDNNTNTYTFHSIEDNYSHAIINHWTEGILKNYDNHTSWILLKLHPCNLYKIMTNLCKPSNYVCNLQNFDVWKTDAKNCYTAVITELEMD
jgi:catechol-2,3-dioxygenase